MGYPVNEDGALAYDHPATTPTRLTDNAEGYTAPSEAAMEFVLSRLEVKSDTLEGVPFWYTSINGTCLMVKDIKPPCDLAWRVLRQEVTALCQEYAAQAVAAERARLAVAISRAFYALPSSNGHEIKGQEQMCIAAINLVKAE